MNRLKLAKISLIVNAVFWLGLVVYYSLFMQGTNVDDVFVKAILIVESVMYVALYFGLKNKVRFAYTAALIITGMNAFLSLTDQVGFHDIVAFILSLAAFVLLLIARDDFRVKKIKN